MSNDDGQVPGQIQLPGFTPPGRGDQTGGPESGTARPRGASFPTTTRGGAPLPQLDNPNSTPELRERMFSFLTGRHAGGATGGDLSRQLITAYGASRTDPDRPDTARVAKGLGVSQRSVQRWLKGDGRPRAERQTKITRTARQAMSTKRGRQRALAAADTAGTSKRPAGMSGLKIGGKQGVTSDLEGNYRARNCTVGFRDEDLNAMRQVWLEHGDAGAAAFLQQHFHQRYESGWHIRSIDKIEWGHSPVYNDNE